MPSDSTAPGVNLQFLPADDPRKLQSLVDWMRVNGVSDLTVGPIALKLGAAPRATMPPGKTPPNEQPTRSHCRCGHPDYEHGPAGCYRGCEDCAAVAG